VVDQRDGSEGWIGGMDRRGGLEGWIGETDRRDGSEGFEDRPMCTCEPIKYIQLHLRGTPKVLDIDDIQTRRALFQGSQLS
jgi:hypothetical protein